MPDDADSGPGRPDELAELLVDLREDMRTEVKDWLDLDLPLHKAKLANAVIALANYGGGRIVIGFTGNPLVPATSTPPDLDKSWTSDRFNGMVGRYLAPRIHCEVRLVGRPGAPERFPIVLVPGITKVPDRVPRGRGTGDAAS